MSSQPPLKCLIGREVFEACGRVFRWEDVFLWSMVRGEWERHVDRVRLTLACAKVFRAAGRKIATRSVEEAAEEFRYAHKLEPAATMRQWLHYWRLTPERWRRALLLQAVQSQLTDADKTSFAKSVQPKKRQVSHWLRPLGAVSGAFQELAEGFASHAAIHDSLRKSAMPEDFPRTSTVTEDSPLPSAGARGQGEGGGEGSKPPTDAAVRFSASAAVYLGIAAQELRDKAEDLLAIERSVERFRQSVATADVIRRQIACNLMGWTQIRYDVLRFASLAAAREAADCIRLDGEAPEEVADRAGIAMEQATRFYTELERPLAAVLLSAGTNEWIGPLEIAGRQVVFRIRGKTPPRPDDPVVVDRIAAHFFTQAMDSERRARVSWRAPF
jgi:hypothetical protein